MKNNKIAITQPITIHKLNPQHTTSITSHGTGRGTRTSRRVHSRSNKTRRRRHSLSPKLHITNTMRGGAAQDREPFRSQGIFELTGDAMLYVLSNVVKLASNMIAASVGYVPINNTLGQPGSSQSDGGVFKDISALVGYAKIPINTMLKLVDSIAAQYINILNGQMRVTTPMMQEALTVTVNILKTQLAIATNTLNNPSFIAVLRTLSRRLNPRPMKLLESLTLSLQIYWPNYLPSSREQSRPSCPPSECRHSLACKPFLTLELYLQHYRRSTLLVDSTFLRSMLAVQLGRFFLTDTPTPYTD